MDKACLLLCFWFLFYNTSFTQSFADQWEYVDIAVQEDGYTIWGTSPVMTEDGKVHLFVARWPQSEVDPYWRSHSEIAHYVGDDPEGPFVFSDIALQGTGSDTWDKFGMHNPNIHKIDNQFVLLYIANDNPQRPYHPSNQKIGMAIADSPYGPWNKVNGSGLVLDVPKDSLYWNFQASNGVNNPALLKHPKGGYFLYFKSAQSKMGVAIAENLTGPYVQLPFPVTKNDRTIEDGYAFVYQDQVALLTTDNHGIIEDGGGLLWKSEDGIHFDEYEKGFHTIKHYIDYKEEEVRNFYGPPSKIKFERPQLLIIDNQPAYLYVPSGKNVFGGNNTISYILKNKNYQDQILPQDQFNPKLALQDISSDNLFKTEGYYNWGASIVKGSDGLYHLFYSRWKKEHGFKGWLTHSEIAHATSANPSGPWTYKETALKGRGGSHWDGITAHNPKIKFFNGQYYLYYIATNAGDRILNEQELKEAGAMSYTHNGNNIRTVLRNNQRTGVAISDHVNGPWTRVDTPLIQPSGPIKTIVVNPAITQGHDNQFYMIVKGDKPDTDEFIRNQAIAIGPSPTGPFELQDKAVIDDLDTEDMSMFYDEKSKLYYGVFHAHSYIGMVVSEDGVNWKKAKHDVVLENDQIKFKDGSTLAQQRVERPFFFTENGKVKALCLAVKNSDEAYTLTIPMMSFD